MSQANVDLIKAMYAAFERADINSLFESLDSQVEFHQSGEIPWGGEYKGHDAFKAFLHKLTSAVDSRVEHDRFLDSGDHVISVGRTVGKVRANGNAFSVPAIHIFKLRDGRVVRIEVYLDNPMMLAALKG